ncbi:solute carrier family 66 member 3 isoform X2 [Salmo salar]|uniref:Solute carrier family 66 member 3 isoform X2 n=1 Tax=Salmo salar TaxID=8030 RepID=A0A1S3M8X1_SALSA|nr:solute carrier family 66 member 3-like isoform X2 [Salmo salar]|eukprot:XP_013999406.1 PREDICTED: PQ-loop repeat-containing protein 3-like isoform X2 [Salmo salar]
MNSVYSEEVYTGYGISKLTNGRAGNRWHTDSRVGDRYAGTDWQRRSLRYVVFVTYQIHHAAPSSTFLEYPILIAQDTVLLLLILYYNGKAKHSLIYIALFVGGWKLVTLQDWIIDLAMSLCTLISASSKFASAQCLYQSKDSSGVSALAWSISCYTCLARMFTTIMTTADIQVLTRFAVLSSLNGFVLAMIFHYRRDVKKVE